LFDSDYDAIASTEQALSFDHDTKFLRNQHSNNWNDDLMEFGKRKTVIISPTTFHAENDLLDHLYG